MTDKLEHIPLTSFPDPEVRPDNFETEFTQVQEKVNSDERLKRIRQNQGPEAPPAPKTEAEVQVETGMIGDLNFKPSAFFMDTGLGFFELPRGIVGGALEGVQQSLWAADEVDTALSDLLSLRLFLLK